MNAFAVVKVVNGNYTVESEWPEDQLNQARMNFHEVCKNLWNEQTVKTAVVRLVDRNFLTFTNYVEEISHPEEVEE